MPETKRPLKVFLCHIMPVGYAHADRDAVPQGDDMRGLYACLTKRHSQTDSNADSRTPTDKSVPVRESVRKSVDGKAVRE